jgi:hypothetical protein
MHPRVPQPIRQGDHVVQRGGIADLVMTIVKHRPDLADAPRQQLQYEGAEPVVAFAERGEVAPVDERATNLTAGLVGAWPCG